MAKMNLMIAGQAPTLLNAEKANELIGYVNGLLKSKGANGIVVDVGTSGEMTISIDNTGAIGATFTGVVVENGVAKTAEITGVIGDAI